MAPTVSLLVESDSALLDSLSPAPLEELLLGSAVDELESGSLGCGSDVLLDSLGSLALGLGCSVLELVESCPYSSLLLDVGSSIGSIGVSVDDELSLGSTLDELVLEDALELEDFVLFGFL